MKTPEFYAMNNTVEMLKSKLATAKRMVKIYGCCGDRLACHINMLTAAIELHKERSIK